MKKWFVFLVCLWAFQASAQSTYRAATCSISDVRAAITAEQANPVDGDIISIPSGTCTWTGTTGVTGSFTKNVTIQGAGAISATTGGTSTTGTDVTSIADNITRSGGNPPLIQLSIAAGKTMRVTGLALLTNGSSQASNTGILDIRGSSSSQLRLDHSHIFVTGGNVGLYIGGALTGVADHNYFESAYGSLNNMFAMHNGQSWNGDTAGSGDKSWADTDHWGTSQFFYFEDNRFRNGGIGDSHDGARYAIRHSTVVQDNADQTLGEGQMYNHGLTSARGRSMRAAEVYQNTFTVPGTTGVNHPTFSVNGGTLLFWGNTVTQYREAVGIDYTRKDNGTYPYAGGWGNCNGAGTFTAWDVGSTGYPCLDSFSRGAGDLITGGGTVSSVMNTTTGAISTSHQALSPIYVFNNTWTPAGGYSPVSLVSAGVAMIQRNRDYYQQFGNNAEPGSFDGTAGVGQGLAAARPATCTAGPGGNTPGVGYWATDTNTLYVCNPTNTWTAYYTPYTYPHPLIAGATTGTAGNSPTPPTGLTASVQ